MILTQWFWSQHGPPATFGGRTVSGLCYWSLNSKVGMLIVIFTCLVLKGAAAFMEKRIDG